VIRVNIASEQQAGLKDRLILGDLNQPFKIHSSILPLLANYCNSLANFDDPNKVGYAENRKGMDKCRLPGGQEINNGIEPVRNRYGLLARDTLNGVLALSDETMYPGRGTSKVQASRSP
jgi:hypothetical protein